MDKIIIIVFSSLFTLAEIVLNSDSAKILVNQKYKYNLDHEYKRIDLVGWKIRWKNNILAEAKNRYCDEQNGEEIGWLVSPLLNGFYYGYMATHDVEWINMLVDCTDRWIRRAVTEPDGYLGWPKYGAAGTSVDGLDDFYADSLLGEAMALRPITLMSRQILVEPRLREYYAQAERYIKLSERIFEKWERRGAWRDTEDGGTISIIVPFGIDQKTSAWTDGYVKKNALDNGFSHPNNKANIVATWLLAMFDATGEAKYKERADRWFRLMKSRMTLNYDGSYQIWNYWQPAGVWDYRIPGLPKHWIGIHPNPGYYEIDVEAIVAAFEHGVVFNRDDINRLVKTSIINNRHWTALVPYSETSQRYFEKNNNPDSWVGLSATPWYLTFLARQMNSDR